jgi:hypothetical protein
MTDDVLAAAPRTEAGRRLADEASRLWWQPDQHVHVNQMRSATSDVRAAILAIEAGAAAPPDGYTIVPIADVGLNAERLAVALPAIAHVLWSRSEAGDHQQVWFDEDVLRHFHEWAEDTAAVIAREYAALETER